LGAMQGLSRGQRDSRNGGPCDDPSAGPVRWPRPHENASANTEVSCATGRTVAGDTGRGQRGSDPHLRRHRRAQARPLRGSLPLCPDRLLPVRRLCRRQAQRPPSRVSFWRRSRVRQGASLRSARAAADGLDGSLEPARLGICVMAADCTVRVPPEGGTMV
jgi:hypothetical protein